MTLQDALKILLDNKQTSIELGSHNIGDSGVQALSDALKVNTSVTSINLMSNNIGASGAQALGEALKVNTSLTSVNLMSNNIGASGAQALSEALKVNTSLTSINLYSNSISAIGTQALSEALKVNTSVTSINLYSNNIGASGAQALSEALKVNTSLTSVYLSDNNLGASGAQSLSEALRVNASLTSVELWGNNLGASGAQALSEALKVNTSLTSITLSKNDLGDSGVQALSEALKVNASLTLLHLVGNNINSLDQRIQSQIKANQQKAESLIAAAQKGDLGQVKQWVQAKASLNFQDDKGNTALHYAALHGHHAIADYLVSQPQQRLLFNREHKLPAIENRIGQMTLQDALKILLDNKQTSIDLSKNNIGDSGVQALSEALKVNTSLTSVDLRYNSIGNSGAQALSEALKVNTSVTLIRLSKNDLGDSGIQALSEALKVNTSLTSVDLRYNDIGASGAQALSKALMENTSLTSVDLRTNKIGDSGAQALSEALKENTSVTSVNLMSNRIGARGAQALSEALKVNTSLTSVNLTMNKIGASGAQALSEALKVNTSLISVGLGCNNVGGLGQTIGSKVKANQQKAQSLIAAAQKGDLGQVKQWVQAKASLNFQDDQGNTALHYAALHGHHAIADYLVSQPQQRLLFNREHKLPAILSKKQEEINKALAEALRCREECQLAVALQWYDQVLQLDQRHILALQGKADILYAQAQLQQAQAIYRHITKLDSKHLHASDQLKAITNTLQQQADEAMRLQQQHEQVRRQEQAAELAQQAKEYFEQDDFSAALTTLSQAIELQPQHLPYHLERSRLYLKLNNYQDALTDCQTVLRHPGEHVGARYQRGLCYQGLGKHELAIADFKVVVQQQPEYGDAYYQLGYLWFKEKHYPQAITALDAAIRYQPEAADAYRLRAQAFFEAEQYDNSLQDIDRLLALNPSETAIQLLKGLNLSAKGEHPAAIACFNQVLRKERFHLNGRFNRAYSQQQLGDYAKALSDYTLLVKQLENRQDESLLGVVLFCRGSVHQAMGNALEAHQDMQQAASYLTEFTHLAAARLWLAPDLQLAIADQETLLLGAQEEQKRIQQEQALERVSAAKVYLDHGTLDLALQQCKQALAIDSTCVEAYWLQGSLYQRQNRWDEAFRCFATVEGLNPKFHGIQTALANAKKEWDKEQAQQAYQRWLAEDAPKELFNAMLQGLGQGVTIESASFAPLYGLCENGKRLSPTSVALLKQAWMRVLFTSQLLNKNFEQAHQPIVVYKLVERLLTLFASEVQGKLFALPKVGMLEIGLKPNVTLQKIEEQMSTALIRAQDYIKQQEQQQQNRQALQGHPAAFFTAPRISHPVPSQLRIKTLFGKPVEFNLAMVAILRAKTNEHALLVMMQLSDNDILQMFGYHFRPHPEHKHLGLVHIAQERITVSSTDTEEQLLQKQDAVLLNKKFAEFPIKDCIYQAFSISLEQAQQLHASVGRDFARNGQNPIPYFLYGNKSLFAPSLSSKGHSCFTWAREKLKDIGLPVSEDRSDYLVAKTSHYLRQESQCLTM